MVSEFMVSRPDTFFDQQDRAHLRSRLLPPAGARIWIGQYVGERKTAGWIIDRQRNGAGFTRPNGSRVRIDDYCGTYSIGQVAFQLIVARGYAKQVDGVIRLPLARAEDWKNALFQLYPPPKNRFTWPPRKAFDDEGFQYLAGRWHEHSPGWQVSK
jgi:hypothetical protein